MSYSSVAEVQKIAVYKDGTTDLGGKIAQAIATADLAIKARIKKVGLTPPSADDTLNVASQFMARGILRRMKREEGSLPTGEGTGMDTYDATNKAVDSDTKFAMEKVDEYIQYSKEEESYDTDGQERVDAIGTQFQLDQNDIGGFTES